jgi:hypothetical protein
MDNADATAARARIRAHLDHGAPWDACDAFREAAATFPDDAELLYLGALAHARAGATHEAHPLLERAAAATTDPALLTEILSLRGRLWKDAFARTRTPALAGRARAEYLAAYALAHDPFPGINAATLALLQGDAAAARDLAQAILRTLEARTATRSAWDHATAGEAELLLGNLDRAAAHYAAAWKHAERDAGSVASMRRQLQLIADVVPGALALLRVLPAPDVVAFAGHMIDAPERAPPRFPAALEAAVAAALRSQLESMRTPIVYTSAACGADLICIEQALAVGAEVNVVLPFARDDFVRTSVAPGGAEWVARFDAALERASRVVMATEEAHLGDDVLYDHAARLVDGLALLRAAQLATAPSLVCVLDPAAGGDVGGTLASYERWRRRDRVVHAIDLRALRGAHPFDAPSPRAKTATFPPAAAEPGVRAQRSIKTMLFADFAGYSRLHDAYAPLFQSQFLAIGAAQIEASPAKPLEAKTWGDGLYLVFDAEVAAAEFALGFLQRMLAVDWTAARLPPSSQIRIALHAGPVFRAFDSIMERESFFGANVTRAARIEPVTPPGMIYASEAFAAILAAEGPARHALEYVGRLPLAKGYGASRLYRLERR